MKKHSAQKQIEKKGPMRILKYPATVLLLVVLFAAQYLASRCGTYVSGMFDYSFIDADGLFAGVAPKPKTALPAFILRASVPTWWSFPICPFTVKRSAKVPRSFAV